MGHKRPLCSAFALVLMLSASASGAAENLARRASAWATSVHSAGYEAKHAIDGVIPQLLDKNDRGRAWVVNGSEARHRARFVLEWPQPVTVGEIIYYGRTSWLVTECWRDYEVRLDDRPEPVARGRFEMNAGPQRIPVPTARARKVTLDFLSSYGGSNPGAAEIEVYSASPPASALPKLRRLPTNWAMKARVSATSEYDARYKAKFAVDGNIPAGLSRRDVSQAWAVKGAQAKGKARFSLEWDQPVTVAEVVYYGRTAMLVEECFKDYAVWLDGDRQPAARGQFGLGSGAQVVRIEARAVRKVVLEFLSSHGGPNPGAAEIQVFDGPAPENMLQPFKKGGWDAPKEDPALTKAVAEGRLGLGDLLVVERQELNPSHVYTACCEGFQPGGGLRRLSPAAPGGKLSPIVASPQGQIMDYDLSFDAKEIVFSWRRSARDTYQIYRVNVDGAGLVPLTRGPHHNYNACWLPDGGVAFVSTRAAVFALCFVTPSGVLYRMDRDGGRVRRLSANYVNDFTPSVMHDGRILYARWEYVDKPAIPIQSLWTINPDGTGLAVYYGNRVLSPASFLEARAIPGTREVLCTLTAHNGPIRGGVGIIDRAWGVNAQKAIRSLTPQVNIGRVERGSGNQVKGQFEGPYPLDSERFLVSGKGSIYVGDRGGKWAVVLPRRQSLGYYNPQPLRPRPRPAVVPAQTPADASDDAVVHVVDVYQGLMPHVRRGEVKQICVIQEVAKPLRTSVRGFGFQRPVISCGATYAVKKVWGYARVAADGSAAFRVPTGVPLYFAALDEHGRAVQRMRSFTHFMPGERQTCIGCHEPRTDAPPRRRPAAVARGPQELQEPEWGTGGFDYVRIVQPVLDGHCVVCHSGADPPRGLDLTGDKTDWFSASYALLTREHVSWIDTRNGREANILQIEPKRWGSPASKLGRVILSGHPDHTGAPRLRVSAAYRRRIFAWMDLNVPYYGTYEMADPKAPGGRRVYPKGLDEKLAEVAHRRCSGCHPAGVPSRGFVRLTRPELNDFLLAPLARMAGGRDSCGKPIFRTKADPDYQAILRLFEPTTRRLAARARMDMPGAEPGQVSRSCR